MPPKKPSNGKDNGLSYPYNRPPKQPVIAGTVAWRHMEGKPFCFVLDEHGKAHPVEEWELTHVELASRQVRDPARRSHLFDPQRAMYPGDAGDAVDEAGIVNAKAARQWVRRLVKSIA